MTVETRDVDPDTHLFEVLDPDPHSEYGSVLSPEKFNF